jgi:nicotinamide phosphoribosyltransferase
MCSNFAVDGDEITHVKRLLLEIYPNHNFSMVSDSYDYWHLVEEILPQCEKEIMNHNGTISIRGDSGNPVEVITKTVFKLWDIFGGTVNSKGYKVLNHHVKAIYGDSITPQRCEAIYKILHENGFAINNVTLGVGSFSMMCLETFDEDGRVQYSPYTRDTFGIAVKATYAEDEKRNPIMIYKQPKALSWKKSQKGCCVVALDGQSYIDECTWDEVAQPGNLIEVVFENGEMIREYTLSEIRNRLHGGNF